MVHLEVGEVNMKKKKEILIYCFCFLTATIILLFCSQNSPLYPMNDWVDVNAFFTVGKGMVRGIIPYKDLFEQKGPILYLIYGIGSLITNHSFFGVFIIECIFQSICLYYAYKIIKLFIHEKYAFIILPIMFTVICTCSSFCHGGSAEEFCFPFFMISLYHFLNYIKNNQMNRKIIFTNGLIAGIIFLIKYNLCGFWFAWMMFLFFDHVFKKQFKKGFEYCFIFLGGMILPLLIFSIYFMVNGALGDFFYTYFVINTTKYGSTNRSILSKIIWSIIIFSKNILRGNGVYLFLLFIGVILFIGRSLPGIQNKIYLCFMVLISIIFTFIGGHTFPYYSLVWILFTIFAWIQLFKDFDHFLPKIKNFKYSFLIIIPIMFACIFISYQKANYKFLMFKSKEEFAQYSFSEIILKDEDHSLLNYGFLDLGVYFTTHQNPPLKHFEIQNLDYSQYPDHWDEQNQCIKDKCVNYVVMISGSDEEGLTQEYPNLMENYRVISSKYQRQDYNYTNYYLLKKR